MVKFSERYDVWLTSQEGQNSAYEYERSFDEFMQHMGRELLQASVREEKSRRKSVSVLLHHTHPEHHLHRGVQPGSEKKRLI